MLENIEELLLSLGLHMQLEFMHTRLCFCVHRSILGVLHTWEWVYVRRVSSVYAGFDLHT